LAGVLVNYLVFLHGTQNSPKQITAQSPLPFRQPNGGSVPMCDKCEQLDRKIEHYQKLLLGVGDQLTVDRIKSLIADLRAQKAALHPEQEQ